MWLVFSPHLRCHGYSIVNFLYLWIWEHLSLKTKAITDDFWCVTLASKLHWPWCLCLQAVLWWFSNYGMRTVPVLAHYLRKHLNNIDVTIFQSKKMTMSMAWDSFQKQDKKKLGKRWMWIFPNHSKNPVVVSPAHWETLVCYLFILIFPFNYTWQYLCVTTERASVVPYTKALTGGLFTAHRREQRVPNLLFALKSCTCQPHLTHFYAPSTFHSSPLRGSAGWWGFPGKSNDQK